MISANNGGMNSALIVFPDEWLSYSPTILNIISLLVDKGWAVTVYAVYNERYQKLQIANVKIFWVKMPKLPLIRFEKHFLYKFYKLMKLVISLRNVRYNEYSVVIGVDSIGYCALRTVFSRGVLLSLEVARDVFWKICQYFGIDTLIIQTEERRDYVLKDMKNVKTFFLQNAPIYDRVIPTPVRTGYKLIYFGNIIDAHGVEYCIESLNCLDDRYTLTLKGSIYERYRVDLERKYHVLFNTRRIILDCNYVEQHNVLKYLADYDIGFCFYSEEVISAAIFDYISAPSGKLFNYYAAGVPVIGTNIIGLKSVSDFNAGILLNDSRPEHIKKSLEIIKDNYDIYVKNCYRAAKAFDFNDSFNGILVNLGLN